MGATRQKLKKYLLDTGAPFAFREAKEETLSGATIVHVDCIADNDPYMNVEVGGLVPFPVIAFREFS